MTFHHEDAKNTKNPDKQFSELRALRAFVVRYNSCRQRRGEEMARTEVTRVLQG